MFVGGGGVVLCNWALLSCRCSCFVSLPRCAVGWSMVCDSGIPWPCMYPLASVKKSIMKMFTIYAPHLLCVTKPVLGVSHKAS